MVRVLLVEDDVRLATTLSKSLTSDGFVVGHESNGLDALSRIKLEPPEVLLLDVGLPGIDGYSICENLRIQGLDFPIIMLTGHDTKSELVHGLAVGADDYITKPFVKSELLARMNAVLRRSSNKTQAHIEIGKIVLDQNAATCFVDNRLVDLTPTEFRLLNYLMQKSGILCRRSQIIKDVWTSAWLGPTKNLDMHVSSLRRKLGPGAIQLHTVRGLGFRLDEK